VGLGLECVACHASAAKSTRAEDNNLPSKQVCLDCHQDVTIKAPRETAVARFNHEKHVAMLRCLDCHHQIDQSDVTSKANFPAMAECMACHSKVDMPESCYFCHAKSMRLTPADHVADFIDSHSRKKHSAAERASCEVCHGPEFHCAGCH